MGINKKQIVLLASTLFLCGAMIYVIPVLTTALGKTIGYIASFCVYWFVFCIPISVFVMGGVKELRTVYSMKSEMRKVTRTGYYFLALIPCIAVFFAAFIKVAPLITIQILSTAMFFALINGTIEELFWRGVYIKIFNNRMSLAYIYPAIFFGVWHIGLYLAKGIHYQGGLISLVGGASFMGWLWGWVAYKTKAIKIISIVHIMVNFFAFTALIYENWYV